MLPYELLVREAQEVLKLSQVIAVALGYTITATWKTILLKTPHTGDTGHKEMNLTPNKKLPDN